MKIVSFFRVTLLSALLLNILVLSTSSNMQSYGRRSHLVAVLFVLISWWILLTCSSLLPPKFQEISSSGCITTSVLYSYCIQVFWKYWAHCLPAHDSFHFCDFLVNFSLRQQSIGLFFYFSKATIARSIISWSEARRKI